MIEGFKPPCVVFRTRVRDESIGGDNPYRWEDVTSDSLFKGKRVVLFSLPGAFTPICSTYQLPGFEKNYDNICNAEIDEIYCISVNDAFVMNAWSKQQDLHNVKVIPAVSMQREQSWQCPADRRLLDRHGDGLRMHRAGPGGARRRRRGD